VNAQGKEVYQVRRGGMHGALRSAEYIEHTRGRRLLRFGRIIQSSQILEWQEIEKAFLIPRFAFLVPQNAVVLTTVL